MKTSPLMSWHGSQERMEAGSPSAAPPSASLQSSPLGLVLRSTKRCRVSRDGSCQQARRLKMPLQMWGPQTSSMAAQWQLVQPRGNFVFDYDSFGVATYNKISLLFIMNQ